LPSDGGRFEVTVDGDLIFSKVAEGRFPENAEILAKL
jgi:selT/selW/selH-like putative selenoprotein|tara:strand:- start:87 stop:197 length:111 start_codon:yes stop_codon:yes gene_type:complete